MNSDWLVGQATFCVSLAERCCHAHAGAPREQVVQRAINQRSHGRDQARAPLRHRRQHVGRIARPVDGADGGNRLLRHRLWRVAVEIGDVRPDLTDADSRTIVETEIDLRKLRDAAGRSRVQHQIAAIVEGPRIERCAQLRLRFSAWRPRRRDRSGLR